MKIMYRLNRPAFYTLSFTWGALITLVGFLISFFMVITGHKGKRHGLSHYYVTGKKPWGGMSWGMTFITDRTEHPHTLDHECGHAIQNCFFGPFMLLAVCVPSFARYWSRRVMMKKGRRPKTDYDSVWFERQASELGSYYCRKFN